MNDEAGAAGSDEAKEPSAADEIQEAVKNVSDQLSGGERLIALGALVILLVCWVVGSLFFDDFGLAKGELFVLVGVLAAMYFYYSKGEAPWHPLYGTIVKVGAWAIALAALYDFIDDTLIDSVRYSGATLFYEIVWYIGAAVMAVGAWQMRGDTR